MRRCYICRKRKPLQEFSHDASKPEGHSYRCRGCDNQLTRDRYWQGKVHKPVWILKSMITRCEMRIAKYERLLKQERNELREMEGILTDHGEFFTWKLKRAIKKQHEKTT